MNFISHQTLSSASLIGSFLNAAAMLLCSCRGTRSHAISLFLQSTEANYPGGHQGGKEKSLGRATNFYRMVKKLQQPWAYVPATILEELAVLMKKTQKKLKIRTIRSFCPLSFSPKTAKTVRNFLSLKILILKLIDKYEQMIRT